MAYRRDDACESMSNHVSQAKYKMHKQITKFVNHLSSSWRDSTSDMNRFHDELSPQHCRERQCSQFHAP